MQPFLRVSPRAALSWLSVTGLSACVPSLPLVGLAPRELSQCHVTRQDLAREFGATDIVEERGDAGVDIIKEMFDGVGADCVLECVGTKESMDQAIRSTRPGGMVGYVGVPNGGAELPIRRLFSSNVGVNGGVAPVRGYIEELLPEVLSGAIKPGLVFDLELPLAEAAEAYLAMDERRATKVLLRP
jgi:threonine dehydrogenase-like Zn-dependent dehydrogenase